MFTPLLSTKFYIPPGRAEGVARPRLTEKLRAGVNRPGSITLLAGPPGFGKTTLLSEFAALFEGPLAWLSLDEGDNDPICFWTYLITACQSIQNGVGETALALLSLPQPLTGEVIPTILINDFAGLECNLALILDDYHVIQNQVVQRSFSYLLDHLPSNLHIVVSTRVDPPWALARFRARNRLFEIRAKDLRFTTVEAAEFLNRATGLDLSAEDVAALEARTEGWAAGLQLAALSMMGRSDIAGFISAFTGSHTYVAEYLVEEVLQRQSQQVQSFLMQTSILERLNAGLCDAVTGRQGSQAMLSALQRANLFVLPLDDEGRWFRYHHLFADLLQARLHQSSSANEISGMHQRAANWFEQEGMSPDAIGHFLSARDYPRALQLIEKIALPVILQAYVSTVEGWLQSIPLEYLERSARANMAYAWMHLLRGVVPQAGPYLQHLSAMFLSLRPEDVDPSLEGEWLTIQSRLANMQGKPAMSMDLANQALKILPEADLHVRSMALVNLATASQQMLDYDRAAESFQMIVKDAQATQNIVLETLGISGRAQMMLQQGRLHLAFEIAQQGIERFEASRKANSFSATLYGEIGLIYYHWHQLDQARRHLLRSVQISGPSGYSDPEIFYHVMLSRISQMEGNWDASTKEIRQAGELMLKAPPIMIREEVVSQQVRVQLASGKLDEAYSALEAEGFTFGGGAHPDSRVVFDYPHLSPGDNVIHPLGLIYNSALRILLHLARRKNDLADVKAGIELAGLLVAGELQCRQIPIALETLLLRSQLYAALGDSRSSLADAVKALELAEPEGFISAFVEEGVPVAEVLTTLLKNNMLGAIRPGYVQSILDAFPTSTFIGAESGEHSAETARAEKGVSASDELALPVESLTHRELEVLQLIAGGASNQAIAEKLVITISAVKKHTGNIYNKLGVNSRTQAVAHARRIGLLISE